MYNDIGDIMNNYEFFAHRFNVPIEVSKFLFNLFELYEVRGIVGNWKGIKFEIRSKETPHNEPHVHASYGEFNVSIDILTLKSKGKMPLKKQKYAIEWVEQNKENLLGKWKNIKIDSKLQFTSSALSLNEEKV